MSKTVGSRLMLQMARRAASIKIPDATTLQRHSADILCIAKLRNCSIEDNRILFRHKKNVCSVCNLSTKEHKSKSAAITQTGNRVQNLAGVRNETKSSESKFGKAQVSIC